MATPLQRDPPTHQPGILAAGLGDGRLAQRAARLRYAPPPTQLGRESGNALSFDLDQSVRADQSDRSPGSTHCNPLIHHQFLHRGEETALIHPSHTWAPRATARLERRDIGCCPEQVAAFGSGRMIGCDCGERRPVPTWSQLLIARSREHASHPVPKAGRTNRPKVSTPNGDGFRRLRHRRQPA